MQQPSLGFALNGHRASGSDGYGFADFVDYADRGTQHSQGLCSRGSVRRHTAGQKSLHAYVQTPHSRISATGSPSGSPTALSTGAASSPASFSAVQRRSPSGFSGGPGGSPTAFATGPGGSPTAASMRPETPIWGDRNHFATMQAQPNLAEKPAVVSVIAPGGGTGINNCVYAELGRNPRFQVEVVGQSRAQYDIYPETWPDGRGAPNLATFADDIVNQGVLERTDCLVCGSRGGQVVLPYFWAVRGAAVPPAVVINGGAAMNLPEQVHWPENAATFLLIGGQDNFRGQFTPEQYVADTHSHVLKANSTTAILYVNEMLHMPQAPLLAAVLPLMLQVLLLWKSDRSESVVEVMRYILQALSRDGWSGRLLFTKAPGAWEDVGFSPFQVDRLPAPECVDAMPHCEAQEVIQHTRHDDMKDLWKRAANAVSRGGGAPLRHDGDRMAAVAQAAKAQAEKKELARQEQFAQETAQMRQALFLPVPRGGQRGDTGRPLSPTDPTPISRALGITRAPHASPATCQSHASCNFFPDPSPKRSIYT